MEGRFSSTGRNEICVFSWWSQNSVTNVWYVFLSTAPASRGDG